MSVGPEHAIGFEYVEADGKRWRKVRLLGAAYQQAVNAAALGALDAMAHRTTIADRWIEGMGYEVVGPDVADPADDATGFNVAPVRYSANGRETIDRIRDALGDEGFAAYCLGTAMKYEDRVGLKGPAEEDAAKARWYRQMHACVTQGGPDPRTYRAGYEPYRLPVATESPSHAAESSDIGATPIVGANESAGLAHEMAAMLRSESGHGHLYGADRDFSGGPPGGRGR